MKRAASLLTIVAALALASGVPASAEPSDGCATGEVPTSTGMGTGADISGSVLSVFSARACNQSTTLPDAYHGAVFVKFSGSGALFVITVDGDSQNEKTATCADGFIGVRGDASGVHLYGDADGDFSESSGERAPADVASSYATGCTG